jgi:hypothetical protein
VVMLFAMGLPFFWIVSFGLGFGILKFGKKWGHHPLLTVYLSIALGHPLNLFPHPMAHHNFVFESSNWI